MSESEGKRTWSLGCLARLFWLLFGNVALGISAIEVSKSPGGRFSARDIFFWAIVIVLLCVRYADIKFLGGQTATGERALMSHWRRYAVILVGVSLCLWVLVHGLAYLGL